MSANPVHALEGRFYTESEIFEREKHQIFFRTWQFATHVSSIPNPGDFFTFEIAGQSLFIIRNADGVVTAFHNVCQHRAHQLLSGSGNRGSIVCPYHAWTYELSGQLKRAPNMDKVVGFDVAKICLTPVLVENFLGFLFVNLDADARPMSEWYPNVKEQLAQFVPDIERLRPIKQVPIEEQCNWKVSVENYSECYHCRLNHKTFVEGVVDPNTYNIMPKGHCLRHTTNSVNLDRLTYAIDEKANSHATEYSSWFLWPMFSFQVYPGNVLNTYLWRTDKVDHTLAIRGWYSVDGKPNQVVEELAQQDLETTVAEDVTLVESVQRGLNSIGYRPGPLVIDPDFGVSSEHSIKVLYNWWHMQLNADA